MTFLCPRPRADLSPVLSFRPCRGSPLPHHYRIRPAPPRRPGAECVPRMRSSAHVDAPGPPYSGNPDRSRQPRMPWGPACPHMEARPSVGPSSFGERPRRFCWSLHGIAERRATSESAQGDEEASMVPPPSSIVTNAELLRLELLRSAAHARLAAPASGRTPPGSFIPSLRRIVPAAVRTMLATLRRRPRGRTLRPA